jgi:ribosomal protein L29
MVKGVPVKEIRTKSHEELLGELKKLREDLQNIRFTKVSGTAVAKIAKIKVKNPLTIGT